MKSLSLKNSSLKKTFSFSECFDTKATVGSILYSRCLLYIVLFISLINLFYIINIQNTYSLVIFFLVGFITSFFVKNMIIIILFATFVSLFFQSTQYQSNEPFVEGFEDTNDDNTEGYKYSYQGEEPDDLDATDSEDVPKDLSEDASEDVPEKKSNLASEKKSERVSRKDSDLAPKKSSGNTKITPSKASELKKNMADYFNVQNKLLDVLAQAEPLQEQAMAIKEKFSENANTD
jgi:hypothetical protein